TPTPLSTTSVPLQLSFSLFPYTTLFRSLDGGKTAWHCCEIPFVFHNIEKVPVCNDSEETKILEKQMSFAWAQFARTGKPELGVQIGRAHVCTPVTFRSRMPSSA